MTEPNTSNAVLVKKLVLAVVCMFGFGFALVPLYDVFCDLTGINGRQINRVDASQTQLIDKSRLVKVEFATFTGQLSGWRFEAVEPFVSVNPGQMKAVKFRLVNLNKDTANIQAIPSVSPGTAGLYLNKLECFCFEQQLINPSSETEFVMQFFIDTALPKNIKVMTLAYTLFEVENQAVVYPAQEQNNDRS
ncbi:cytochrome c oxidase assembly protein [Catenovulum maritimum]|jgi:cytochrome c oxidase assembly protein subunit 11|uniref:Cytochrome c oxidase assembly protein CtaG n=1 Tax=Catenovulum maritimum TaxID=1513271 RepID=A0A0J8GSX7_9ALTE|nr:cytochrome c oxidase assembly protein [Catenovulum maritimum]KMT64389.1 hypothetical protein XM47_14505 [Catenovulum maritimum]